MFYCLFRIAKVNTKHCPPKLFDGKCMKYWGYCMKCDAFTKNGLLYSPPSYLYSSFFIAFIIFLAARLMSELAVMV